MATILESLSRAEIARQPLNPQRCALVVIDIQEKLLLPIHENQRLVRNSQLLIRLANILKLPVIATTQYMKGLGPIVPEIASLLHLFRRDNARARKRASTGGHRQRKLGKDPLQLGGSFVFGPGNVDRFVHVSETFGDNAQPGEIINALP